MKIPLLGLEVSRTKAAVGVTDTSLFSRGWTRILEPFGGAWQRNIAYTVENVLVYAAVYRCVGLIASDIAKIRLRLVQQDASGIWTETENPAYSPVLRKPNHYQTRIQFFEHWVLSKLITGNAYVLKYRDNRGIVTQLYVLDPHRVRPKVAPDGSVWYQIAQDNLSGADGTTVPASEIIHDVMNPLYHPLCGVSPITACGLAATQGLRVQENSTRFFGNDSRPSGLLSTIQTLTSEQAKDLRKLWQDNQSGPNQGSVAVLGNGMEYKPMGVSAHDAQLIEQLKWTAENVCTAFGVPGYMIGVGQAPTYNNIEALLAQYYAQCLQTHIESIELLLDEGLGLGTRLGTEFDLDDLLRMDTATQVKMLSESVLGGLAKPNEARRKLGYGPVEGGDTVYLQMQNFSLAALAKRDAQDDPFSPKDAEPKQATAEGADQDDDIADTRSFADFVVSVNSKCAVLAAEFAGASGS